MTRLWHTWLTVALAGQILLGFGLVFAGDSALFAPLNSAIDAAIWGAREVPAEARHYQAFAYAVIGATTAGWGLTGLIVAICGVRRGERWAWFALAEGLVLWFVLDTGLSAWHGVGANVIFNCALAASLAVPLAALYPRAGRSSAASGSRSPVPGSA